MFRRSFVGVLFVSLALALSSIALAQSSKAQVDINTASEDEIVAVGIEKPAARKIVEARPYRNKAELVSRQLLTRAQYDKVKDMLIARQSATTKAAPAPARPMGK